MDVSEATGEDFSFIWTIQNYNFCFRKNKDNFYESPAFVLHDKSGEKWCFNIYPERYISHDSIGLSLKKCTGTKGTTAKTSCFRNVAPNQSSLFGSADPNQGSFFGNSAPNQGSFSFSATPNQGSVFGIAPAPIFGISQQSHPTVTDEIMLEISIRHVRGSFEKKSSHKLSFQSNSVKSDISKLKISKEELETCLDNDSLTILCKLSDMKNPILTTRQCYARTIIGIERITYPCTLEDFTGLENDGSVEKRFHISSEVISFTLDLLSTRETYAEIKFQFSMQLAEPKVQCYSFCEILLVDAGGSIVHSVREEHDFNISNYGQVWTFPFIEARKILNNKEIFLSNGVLRLRCEFVFSSGVAYSKVEKTEYGIENSHQLQCHNQITDSSESLKDNLRQFYENGEFSDLTIRTPSKEFRVHKTILCARSKYFSAMIQLDSKEIPTCVVEIEDIDDDTVSKMLLFLYTDSVGKDLEFGMACSLYFAADRYRIVALKRKCSDFLKGNFTGTNVCEVLVLADRHQDEELKLAAQSFIFEKNIIDSEEWKKFMEENNYLASEVMHTMLKRLKKITSLTLI